MKPILITLDFINDIVHKDSMIGAHNAPNIKKYNTIENANRAIHTAKQESIPIMHVKVGFPSTYANCPPQSPIFSMAKKNNLLQWGTWGTEFHPDLQVNPTDIIVKKSRINATYGTSLLTYLGALSIDTVFICGVATPLAVYTTALSLQDMDYYVTIIEDACMCNDIHIHNTFIESLRGRITLTTSQTLFKN